MVPMRALAAAEMRSLLAIMIKDAMEAGLPITALALELTLSVVDFEVPEQPGTKACSAGRGETCFARAT